MCVVVHSILVVRVRQNNKKMSVTVMKNDEEEEKEKRNIDEQHGDSLHMHVFKHLKQIIAGKCLSYILRLIDVIYDDNIHTISVM
jgi:hypothetical protein